MIAALTLLVAAPPPALLAIVSDVHGMMRYGEGDRSALTLGEMRRAGEGHCGHFAAAVAARAEDAGFRAIVVSLWTRRATHAMAEVIGTDGAFVVDATVGVVYPAGLWAMLAEPELAAGAVYVVEPPAWSLPYRGRAFWDGVLRVERRVGSGPGTGVVLPPSPWPRAHLVAFVSVRSTVPCSGAAGPARLRRRAPVAGFVWWFVHPPAFAREVETDCAGATVDRGR